MHTKIFYFIKWDSLVLRRSFVRRLVALNQNKENRKLKITKSKVFSAASYVWEQIQESQTVSITILMTVRPGALHVIFSPREAETKDLPVLCTCAKIQC